MTQADFKPTGETYRGWVVRHSTRGDYAIISLESDSTKLLFCHIQDTMDRHLPELESKVLFEIRDPKPGTKLHRAAMVRPAERMVA